MRFQAAIGLSVTARCPIRCAHCIVEADRRRAEQMDVEGAAALLDAAAHAHRRAAGVPRIEAVFITGGEPFYAPALLPALLARAGERGLVTVVVTNAYWAKDPATALASLRSFPGIDLLTISTDRFHRAFVGLNHIRHALAAARHLGIPCSVAVCGDDPAELAAEYQLLDGIVDPAHIVPAITLPAGRHSGAGSPRPATERGRCTNADVPLVFPDGRVIACSGIVDGLGRDHPLHLGNAWQTPLAAILADAERDVFVHGLRALGPEALAEGLPGDAAIEVPARFRAFGRCALCYAMAAEPALCAELRRRVERPAVARWVAEARSALLDEPMPGLGAESADAAGAPPPDRGRALAEDAHGG